MKDVLDLLEVEYDPGEAQNPAGFKIHSFYKEENTPSLHIYEDHWYDYSQGRGGTQIDFVMEYSGCSFGRAMRLLERGVGDPLGWEKPKVEAKPPEPMPDHRERIAAESEELLAEKHEHLRRKIFEKWGLDWVLLWRCGVQVGPGEALWIPHQAPDGTIPGVKVRDIYSGRKFSLKPSKFLHLYAPLLPVVPVDQVAILTEGESDTWTGIHMLLSYGVAVYGLPSGGLGVKPEMLKPLRRYRRVYYVHDQDDVGFKSMAKVSMLLPGIVEPLELPHGAGDLNEAFRQGWRIESPIEGWYSQEGPVWMI